MLIRYLRGRPKDVAWLAAWSLVQALPSVASGWSLAEAVSRFLSGQTAAGIGWLGLLALAALAGSFGTRQAYLRLGAIVEPLRDELVTAVVAGALARSMETGRPPDTHAVARMTHQAEIVRDSFAGVLSVTCTFTCTVVSTLAGLVTLLPATLPYVVPPLLASALLLRLLLRPYAARQRTAVLAEEAVASSTAQAVSGVRDITACGAEDVVLGVLGGQVQRQAAAVRSVARAGAARLLGLAVGGWLPLLLVLAAAPSMLGRGISPGHVIGAITYITGSLRGALYTLSQGMGAGLVRLTVTLDRIRQTGQAAAPGEPDVTARGPRPTPRLALRDVTFSYGAHAVPVIRDLSLDIPPGDHLAIVGPSGIGKSSLAGLLAGMLRPSAGQVLLDGVPVTASNWRVLIPQQAYVFDGTLEENLTYLRAATKPELDAAAEAVGLIPLLARLGGYGAAVSPAVLSAGERQLVALTRAYLSPAPVVILDEATCHLDPAAEEQAESAFARRGGTLIVIAHRITSALRAKRILVLDGTRAQSGSHAELLGTSPMYADLAGYWGLDGYTERSGETALAVRHIRGG
jgi:ATP-binding cassette, subfamily C, bacterial